MLFKPCNLALSLLDRQPFPIHNGKPCGIIPTILKPLQTSDEDLSRFPITDVAYDAAHDTKLPKTLHCSAGRWFGRSSETDELSAISSVYA
jgi:hypothetical protein